MKLILAVILATVTFSEAHWGGSKHLKKTVVASPYPLRSPGVEDCRTVEDDVLEERCSTKFSQSCHREVDHKCKKLSFPKCKISWEKTCTEEPICSQTFEDV